MRAAHALVAHARIAHALAPFLIFWMAVLAGGDGAEAHRTSIASARLSATEATIRVHLALSAHDLAFALASPVDVASPVPATLFVEKRAMLENLLRSRISVTGDQGPCPASGKPVLSYPQGAAAVEVDLAFRCTARPSEFTFRYLLFFDIDRRHRLVGEFAQGEAGEVGEVEPFVIDAGFNELTFTLARPVRKPWHETIGPIILLGIEHILAGIDHLLFLLALLMVPSRAGALLATVTGFTLAHSLTLALAWFDLVSLPPRYVEAAIALSIAVVAGENLVRRSGSRRWIEASGFGLVHGLGFYSVLKELDLSGAGVISRLVGFNLGVEIGQLAVIAVVIGPLLWWWRRRWYRRSANVLSLLLIAIALVWTVERLAG